MNQSLNEIVPDDWLTNILGKKVYLLKNFQTDLTSKEFPNEKMLIWSKVSVSEVERLICLQKLGFYIVDTNVQFSLSKKNDLSINSNLRFAKLSDEIEVRSIAKNAFKHSRFYKDPNIPNDLASKIKEEWVGNFFSGKRGKWMVVIEENSKILGFLQLIEKNQNTLLIDLIAIEENNRGKGFAKELIYFAYKNCLKNNGFIEVGTQITNSPSIELYLKMGFNINSASYVLHFHH